LTRTGFDATNRMQRESGRDVLQGQERGPNLESYGKAGRRIGMEKGEFVAQLLKMTEESEIVFSADQAGRCFDHAAFMVEWNRKSNLTRITDFREILTKHVLDSIAPGRELPARGVALDVGTGPGYPGIPLKILHPDLDMWLLESNRKKISFLKAAVARIPLSGVHTLHGRWEQALDTANFFPEDGVDLVTMRAVRLEAVQLEKLAPATLRPGGVFAWWAGPCAETGRGLPPGGAEMEFERTFTYNLPGAGQPRRLYIWRRRP